MTDALGARILVETASALLYITLGLWVLTLTPRRPQTKLLGVFTIAFGLIFAPWNLVGIFHLAEQSFTLSQFLQTPFALVASFAMLGMAIWVPRKLEDLRPLAVALGLGFLAVLVSLPIEIPQIPHSGTGATVAIALGILGGTPSAAALILLALRARPSRSPPRSEVLQLALLAVAFTTLEAFVSGTELIANVPAFVGEAAVETVPGIVGAPEILLAIALWGWNMATAREEAVGIHRSAMLAILGMVAAGAAYKAAFPGIEPSTNLMRGVMRTLGVGLLAYGILRHDLAGLDTKVEWGVSKTTVAGVFVAVFFIAGELAETFFGDVFGPYGGVIAAGLLVFAISPLQRLADRFAARAVPGGAGADAEERYRREVEMALADGEISGDEERRLGRRAAELEVDAERALEIREQVKDEQSPAGGGGDG